MPLNRKEFEAAACRIWPPRNAHAGDIRQCCEWVYGLGLAAPYGTSLYDDASFLWRLLETRAKMPANHRLIAAFPRPACREARA